MAKKKAARRTAAAGKKPPKSVKRFDRECTKETRPEISSEPIRIEHGWPLHIVLKEAGIRDDELDGVKYYPPKEVTLTPPADLPSEGGVLPYRKWIWTEGDFTVAWSRSATSTDRRRGFASGKLTITIIRSAGLRAKAAESECFEYDVDFFPS